jgi:hypothetical protein
MKKTILGFCVFLIVASFELCAQPAPLTKGLRKIDCEIVPVAPLSKSNLAYTPSGKKNGPRMSSQAAKSSNWSGYAAFTSPTDPEVGSVTDVWGNWTVPKLHPSHADRYSACWAGIDGYFSQTVEQLGTAQEWHSGQQVNYAWFSMYPGPTYEIVGFPVSPNDNMRALVSYIGSDAFEMILENITQGVYFVIPTFYTTTSDTQRNSAEWIVEAPSSSSTGAVLPLAHFTPVTFSDCLASIRGNARRIDSPHCKHTKIVMVTNSGKKTVVKANPSHLFQKGQSFKVKWNHR